MKKVIEHLNKTGKFDVLKSMVDAGASQETVECMLNEMINNDEQLEELYFEAIHEIGVNRVYKSLVAVHEPETKKVRVGVIVHDHKPTDEELCELLERMVDDVK